VLIHQSITNRLQSQQKHPYVLESTLQHRYKMRPSAAPRCKLRLVCWDADAGDVCQQMVAVVLLMYTYLFFELCVINPCFQGDGPALEVPRHLPARQFSGGKLQQSVKTGVCCLSQAVRGVLEHKKQ
jgi:hypothetical protein